MEKISDNIPMLTLFYLGREERVKTAHSAAWPSTIKHAFNMQICMTFDAWKRALFMNSKWTM